MEQSAERSDAARSYRDRVLLECVVCDHAGCGAHHTCGGHSSGGQ